MDGCDSQSRSTNGIEDGHICAFARFDLLFLMKNIVIA